MNVRKYPVTARGAVAIRNAECHAAVPQVSNLCARTKAALYAWLLIVALFARGASVLAQPIITDFSPKAGTGGDIITVNGTGFTSAGTLTVRFWNGVRGNIIFISSDLQMTVEVPNGASTGPLSIQQGGGNPIYTASDFVAIGQGPYISDFSPGYGTMNDLITINGVHLTNTIAVKFNGKPSTSFNFNVAGTQITARVPAGATNGLISVTTPFGTSNSFSSFTVIGAGPFITGFTPSLGNPGTTVFIDGVHFTEATNATFSGKAGVNFAVQSDTLIRVDTPTNLASGPVAVRSPLGSWTTTSNFYAPPVITNVSPRVGRPGTNVVIRGQNFLGTLGVSFNGVAATNFNVLSNNAIAVVVPIGASKGLVRVTAPAGSTFSGTNFIVQPVVSGFTPHFGPVGTSVKITGANLNVGTPIVRFNDVAAAAPTGISFGQLTAVVPAGARTGRVSVTTTDGGYTNASLFYLPAIISSFSSSNAAPGTRITIQGQNFTDASAVSFNGTDASSFDVTNNTTLGATVPAGLITGPIKVTTPAGTVSSTNLFYGAPIITNFTPTQGLPNTTVTIGGVNFLGATGVLFNGTAAAFTVNNNGQITATVPNAAQSGPITVIGAAGTYTSTNSFALGYTSDLQVGITASPNPVSLGSNLLYTVTVFNNGPNPAQNITLTNVLPPTVTLQSVVGPAGWSFTTNGSSIVGLGSNLVFMGAAAVQITVVPHSIGQIVDSASVGSDYTDPSPLNNTFAVTTTVEPLALLSIVMLTNEVKLTWHAALFNYVLESKDLLGTNTFWSNVTATSTVSGAFRTVTETNGRGSKFYRLRR